MGEKTIKRSMVHGTWLLLLGLLLLLSASLLVTPKGAERSSLGETGNISGIVQQQQGPYVSPSPSPTVTPSPSATPVVAGGEISPGAGEQLPAVAGEQITREQVVSPSPRPAVVGERVRLPITGLVFGRALAILGLALIVFGVTLLVRGSRRRVST